MKNYRILRLGGIHYQNLVQSFLNKHPGFEEKTYNEQVKILIQESPILSSDAFVHAFRQLGQEASEFVIDFEIIQKQWAKENGILLTKEGWMSEIILAEIEFYRPDVIYIQSNTFNIPGIIIKNNPNKNLAEIIKEKFPFVRLIVMFSGYPCGAERIKGVDILFACTPSLVALYRKMGMDTSLLYHSFDESIINKLNGRDKQYGVTFVGSSRAPESRYWALSQLMEETNLEMWLYEDGQAYKKLHISSYGKQLVKQFIKKSFSVLNANALKKLTDSSFLPQILKNPLTEIIRDAYFSEINHNRNTPIRKLSTQSLQEMYPERCHASVMGMDMYNVLHLSTLTFNKHADMAWGDVGNMRLFEATGVGTCLLTDAGNNMEDLFEADKEVVTYTSIDEAVEKAKYLMEHKDVAAEIAKAGQKRTLKDHTTKARCQQIDEVIQANL